MKFPPIITPFEKKPVRECKDYQLRVLFLDPAPYYERVKIDTLKRFNSISMSEIFPPSGKICACGCGQTLGGRRTRWATDSCMHFAQGVWGIMSGHLSIIESYLKLYHSIMSCCECGKPEHFRKDKNGHLVQAIEKDHIVPVYKGGGGCWLTNYQFLCYYCHKPKTNQDVKKPKPENNNELQIEFTN